MKKNLSNSNSRNARTLIAGFLAYVLLASQLTPLALAMSSSLHDAPAIRKASKLQPIVQGAPAAPASMAPVPVPLVFVPNITATKTDNIPQATAVNPGDIITYSITINNTGTDATNVTLNDTVDPNTTIIPSSVNSTPIGFPDGYNVLGNVRIQPNAAAGLLANDIDPDTGNNTGLTASGPVNSTNGGSVLVNADGSFSYNPPAGFEGSDTFTYTVTDTTGKTDTALVTLTVTGMIWFVNAAAGAGGDGRLTTPLNCLTGPFCFSGINDGLGNHPAANDNIFLYSGGYTGGLTLLDNQKLIGQAASATLASIAVVVVPPNSDPLPATGGASPVITSSSNGINIGAGLNNTYRGFTVGNTTGAKIAGTGFGTLTVGNIALPDMVLNGTGQALNLTTGTFAATSAFISVTTTSSGAQGINLAGIAGTVAFGSTTVSGNTTQCILVGTTTANINFGNTSCSGGTDGVSLQNNSAGTRTFGTLGVTGGTGIAFLHAVGGGNTTISGAATLASGNNPVDIQNMAAGTAVNFAGGATVTKTTIGGAGVNLANNNATSTITFDSLGITTSNGTGLSATTGGTVNVTNATKSISATGVAAQTAPAIIANGIALIANFSSVSCNGSGTGGNCISLTTVTGTSNFGSGSLTGATGATFLVNGGGGTVTYNGTITQGNAARVVDIQNKTGGTITLGGVITSNGGTGTGIILNINTGATINFTNDIILSTGGNVAFTATGGGTVSATGINSTITTTTATAVNVANTTIGASNLKFKSITSTTASANSAIVLNTTGNTGGLVVTGTGITSGSGGTISNKTTNGISLTSTFGTSLSNMNINSNTVNGINGTTVTNFSLIGCSMSTNGTIAGQHGVKFTTLLGTSAITNTTISQSAENNLSIDNTSGTLTLLTVSGSTFKDTRLTGPGNDGFLFQAHNAAIATILVNGGNNFTNNALIGAQFQALDTSNVTVTVQSNTFTDNNEGIEVECNSAAHMIAHIGGTTNLLGNTFTAAGVPAGNAGTAILASNFAAATNASDFNVKIEHNNIDIPNGGVNHGVIVFGSGTNAPLKALVDGNTITNNGQFDGIHVNTPDAGSTPVMNITVTNNIVNSSDLLAFSPTISINCNYRRAGTGTFKIEGNTTTSANGGFGIQLRRTLGTVQLERGGSPSNTPSVVLAANNPGASGTGGAINVVTDVTITVVNNGTIIPPLLPSEFSAQAVAPIPVRSETANTSRPANTTIPSVAYVPVASNADFNKVNRQGGATARYAAKDAWLSPASNPVASVQKQRGRISLPRPIVQATANPPVIVGDNITWNVGTLPAGHSVTITVQVQVDNPYTGPPQVSNQGTVTADGGISVLTDDPDAIGANNPTITLVNVPPNINVNDAKAPEPASGSSPMVFTVALSTPAPVSGVTVHYATADQAPGPGHAQAGLDYTAVPDTLLTFASGEQVKTVSVSILSDALVEPDETFLLNLSSATGGILVDGQAVGTITQNVPGTFLISELRTSGPGGPGDDFVELYNNTGSDLTVTASDASAGYGVFKTGTDCNATPVLIATIPNGTIIPARGHYLLAGPTYGLGGYAAGDQTVADIASDSNVAVFSTADVLNLSSANRLDAVGFGSNNVAVCALLQEGTNLQAIGPSALEHSFFRDPCGKGGNPATFGACSSGGKPVDLNNNATDFIFADTASTLTIAGQHLGAPGPENLTSPIERNSTIAGVFLDANKAAAVPPNRVRDFTPVTNGANGTLSIRRRFINNTGANITRLRFRIVDMDSTPVPGGIADIRALTSLLVVVSGITDPATCLASTGSATTPCTVNVQGTTMETPPAQAIGGSLNSSLAAGTVTLGTPLAPGASINLQFLLGVQTPGNFKFFVNIEGLP
jgi:Bacterial Ig domain/Calx-beta domain